MRGVNLSARDLRAREDQIIGVDSAVFAGFMLFLVLGLRLFL
jgi:hypothetical protein